MECTFVGDHVTYFSFSLSFPGFSKKFQISLSFPRDFDNFSNSLSFPGLWPPFKIPQNTVIVTVLGEEGNLTNSILKKFVTRINIPMI